MRLNTRIYDAKGHEVNYVIREVSGETLVGPRTDVAVIAYGKTIGFMKYSLQENHLYIHRMDNYTVDDEHPLKHVGYLLFEYAFKKSLKAGKDGRIELNAIKASPGAYYKMGLRKKSYAGDHFSDLIIKYLSTKDLVTKHEIMQKNPFYYSMLKKDAAKNLNKAEDQITFDEAITHGIYSPFNTAFEAELANKSRLSEGDCYRLYMQGTMYLPPDMMTRKKEEFSRFTPIGSNLFFTQQAAEARIKNPKIKELITSGKLDSSNAIEIEAKMGVNDLRLPYLLSPTGLKMMKRNYISGWYIGVYFHDEAVKAIVSENGLKAFEKGYIRHVNQLVNLGSGWTSLLLSNKGFHMLACGEISLSNSGYSFLDKDGNVLDPESVKEKIQVQVMQERVLSPH